MACEFPVAVKAKLMLTAIRCLRFLLYMCVVSRLMALSVFLLFHPFPFYQNSPANQPTCSLCVYCLRNDL